VVINIEITPAKDESLDVSFVPACSTGQGFEISRAGAFPPVPPIELDGPTASLPDAGVVTDLVVPAGELRPIAGRSGFRHFLGDVELVEEALGDDAVPAVRLRLAVTWGAFADLQAVDKLSFDHVRQDAGGLAVAWLAELRSIDAADPDTNLAALSFHCESVAVRDRKHPAKIVRGRSGRWQDN
jgi:hypothetical protein